jgi:hypothetical protein
MPRTIAEILGSAQRESSLYSETSSRKIFVATTLLLAVDFADGAAVMTGADMLEN